MSKIYIGKVGMPTKEYVVSRNAYLGITRSGKTFAAKGIAEQLIEAGIPIVVFDAIGMWRYLKVPSGPSGKGFPIVVAGGLQPDLPLTPHTAPQIVRAAIQQNINLVIDLYDPKLSKADWRRIVQDCFQILLFENKGLRHIFLEEAAEYVPQQNIMDPNTYAAVEKLARMGGNASLGITFINPRPQELNKSVLELCDNIVLLRQRGKNAIDSLQKQMEKLSPDMATQVANELPQMSQGDCWVFTEKDENPVRTRTNLIKSFHPDRLNPEANQSVGKSVDTKKFVQALSGNLEKVIEEAKANDPAELKKRVKQLEMDLAKANVKASAPKAVVETKPTIIEIPVLTDKEKKILIDGLDQCERVLASFEKLQAKTEESIADIRRFFEPIKQKISSPPIREISKDNKRVGRTAPIQRPVTPIPKNNGELKLEKIDRKILSVLSNFPEGCNSGKICLLAGYAWSGGTRNALARLRTAGAISGGNGDTMMITEHGLSLGPFESLPTGADLLDYWQNHSMFEKIDRTFFEAFRSNPEGLTAERLCEITGYEWSGGTRNSLSRLRTAGVIEGRNGDTMKLAAHLQEHL